MLLKDLPENPFDLFSLWLEEAKGSEPNDPNVMCLATSTKDGRVSNRMVLLNGLDDRGFIFYTNAESRKGNDLKENSFAALCFHWKTLRRQVRIEGAVEGTGDALSDAYYASRPRISRIGSWASQQSRILENFSDLEKAVHVYEEQFKDVENIPRPPYWKGYRVLPEKIEFWIDGPHRLHQRYVYETKRYVYEADDASWTTHMIYP